MFPARSHLHLPRLRSRQGISPAGKSVYSDTNWLCMVVFLPENDPEQRRDGVKTVAYLYEYAQVAEAFLLACLEDERDGAYQLFFSFHSARSRQRFLSLVQSNVFTRTDSEFLITPTMEEIESAAPVELVLPADVRSSLFLRS